MAEQVTRHEMDMLLGIVRDGFEGINARLDKSNGRLDKAEDSIDELKDHLFACPLMIKTTGVQGSVQTVDIKTQGYMLAIGVVAISVLTEAVKWLAGLVLQLMNAGHHG